MTQEIGNWTSKTPSDIAEAADFINDHWFDGGNDTLSILQEPEAKPVLIKMLRNYIRELDDGFKRGNYQNADDKLYYKDSVRKARALLNKVLRS